jgi:hypothetical protein
VKFPVIHDEAPIRISTDHHLRRAMLGGREMECCADCGGVGGEGISLKACKSCMSVKYCNADCQKNHWPRHKKECKQRAAELHDEALFKDPPAKEDCPICFLPMPTKMISCVSLPPATISSIPIADYVEANEELAKTDMEVYYPCCGKSICVGCVYSFHKSGNDDKCPFCNADQMGRTDEEAVEELMKRTAANDATSMCGLAYHYYHGKLGLQQDLAKGVDLYIRAAELGYSKAHYNLGIEYQQGGKLKQQQETNNNDDDEYYTIYPTRYLMLAYMSILNLLSDWTCYSIAPIAQLTKIKFGTSINPEGLVTIFLFANTISTILEPAILGRLGLRRTVLVGALLLMCGSIVKSSGVLHAVRVDVEEEYRYDQVCSSSLSGRGGKGNDDDGSWRLYLGFFLVGLSQPLYQCTPALQRMICC